MLTQPNTNNVRRFTELGRALTNSSTLRRFMTSRRVKDPLRDEEELLWMLSQEMERDRPRRSVMKRLHGAIMTTRQKREWAELLAMVDKAVSGA